jgi:hypothetical protein
VKTYTSIRFAFVVIAAVAVVPALASAGAQTAANAQQKPADKDAAADQAARQAEAVARAAQKVAEDAAAKTQALAANAVPIDVEVVIARYQGDKKLGSLPYTLNVNASSQRLPTRLRMGGAVPMPTMVPATMPDGKPLPVVGGGPVQYVDVGTNIDSSARPLPDGRFEVFVSVEDKWVVNAPQTAQSPISSLPFVRSFQTSNTLVLRDGQTRQFTTAADRVTGEVVKVEVTLKVVK